VKKIAILPTMLTLGNAVCGLAAIAFASKAPLDAAPDGPVSNLALSACFILLAMVFDALDGYAARLSRSASEFGGQLDSLCDAISFGAAPAYLLLRFGREWHNSPLARQAIAVIAALYMCCALLRLARFNVQNSPDPSSHKRFKGLPSPAAAGCVASLALLRAESPSWSFFGSNDMIRLYVQLWAPLGTLAVALLMVSNLPYPHFTNQLLRRRHNFAFVVQVVVAVCLVALTRDLACFLLFWAYALHAPLRYAFVRGLNGHAPRADHAPNDVTPH
jgi:CDP-diacylglycerol--serine O-phosphatidyltransferase